MRRAIFHLARRPSEVGSRNRIAESQLGMWPRGRLGPGTPREEPAFGSRGPFAIGATRFLSLVLALPWLPAAAADVTPLPPAAVRVVDFVQDVQPIFAKSCYGCHGRQRQEAAFRLDSKEIALQGG